MTGHGASRRAFLAGGAALAGGAVFLLGGGVAVAAVAAGGVAAGQVPAGGVPARRTAAAARSAPIPEIIDCDGWGARPNRDVIPVLARRPVRIIVHHTADANGRDLSRDAAIRVARGVQNFHMDRRGWIDSGQQFTISRGGFVLEGRRRSLEALRSGRRHVVGAHCTGQNEESVGIENEGTYGSATPPGAQLDRLRELCAAICGQYGIAPTEIQGHRDYRDTACPGNQLYGLLPQLRVDVARLAGVSLSLARATRPVWPLLREGDRGRSVLAAQHLLRGAGRGEVDPDGEFGPSMAGSVRRFQADRGCEEVNGLIGGETWPQLTRGVRVDRGDGASAVGSLLDGLLRPVDALLDALGWQELLGAVG
ncbi:MAG: peptidoglycan recognition protein family protein [Pseudonocardia sp.]